MTQTGEAAYPYDFDPAKRQLSRQLARSYLRLNIASSIAGLLLLLLLLLGPGVDYANALKHFYWPFSVGLFTATVVSIFFCLELSFSFMRYSLRRKFGLSTQSLSHWLEDQAKGFITSLALSLAAVELAFLLIDRQPSLWWALAATVFVLLSYAYSTLFPLLFARFFYRIRPLEDGAMKEHISSLLKRLGLQGMEVFTLNESSRSRSANAFVTGIGRRKKVVLFDNLLNSFPAEEVNSIVAHELGHYLRRDTTVSMVIGAFMAYATAYVLELTLKATTASGLVYSRLDPILMLWFVLVAGIFQFAITPLTNLYSRRREASADLFSLDITGDPTAFISSEKRLCDMNMMEERIGVLRKVLFATHPSTVERIGMGERWKPGEQNARQS